MKTLLSALALSLAASLSTGCAVAPTDAADITEDAEDLAAEPLDEADLGTAEADMKIDEIIAPERCDMTHMICHVTADGDMLCEFPDADCDDETADATFIDLDVSINPAKECNMVHLLCMVVGGGDMECEPVCQD